MGLSESKLPFEEDGGSRTTKIEKEIGICPMYDPRSPSTDFARTPPVFYRNESVEIRDEDIGSVVVDPRSPSCEITRTPVGVEYKKSAADRENVNVYSELRVQLERLQIFDGGVHNTSTASTENLGNDSEVFVLFCVVQHVLLDKTSTIRSIPTINHRIINIFLVILDHSMAYQSEPEVKMSSA